MPIEPLQPKQLGDYWNPMQMAGLAAQAQSLGIQAKRLQLQEANQQFDNALAEKKQTQEMQFRGLFEMYKVAPNDEVALKVGNQLAKMIGVEPFVSQEQYDRKKAAFDNTMQAIAGDDPGGLATYGAELAWLDPAKAEYVQKIAPEIHKQRQLKKATEGVKSFLPPGQRTDEAASYAVQNDSLVTEYARQDEKKRMQEKNVHAGTAGKNAYTPPVYPGRNMGWETHIFDVHGKLLKADAVPGVGVSTFTQFDRNGAVYVLASSTPYLDGKPYFNGRGCTLFKVVPGKMKGLTPGGIIPLAEAAQPKRPMDMTRPGIWLEGAEWLFGPVGADGHYGSGGHCSCCVNGRFALDYFGRSFAPEVDRFRAVVLDTNGNVITRIGKYGNVDDGMPLVKDGPSTGSTGSPQAGSGQAAPPSPRSIGGDEVAIMHAMNVAVHTDRRFFLADVGNHRIMSVKLGYHAEEKVALKDVKESGKR